MDIVARIGVVLAFVGVGATIVALFAPYHWRNMPKWLSMTGLSGGASLIAIGVLLIFLLPQESFPDVKIKFVQPKQPGLFIVNQSLTKTATNIKYGGLIANISASDPREPLPIPFALFDFLRPNRSSGFYRIFEKPDVARLLKPGDHLFGYISVSCPECARERTYWLYITWGEGGWYSELPENTGVDTKWLYDALPEIQNNYDSVLSFIPQSSRIIIQDAP